MNRFLLSTLAAGTMLASGAVALAQGATAPPPPRQGFFGEMDTNKDGVVTRAEVTAVLDKRFAALDTDRNGAISPAERQARRDGMWAERFAAMDTDRNGQLSPAELKAAHDRKGPGGDDGRPGRGPGFERKGHGGHGFGDSWRDRGPVGGPRADKSGADKSGDVTKEAFMRRALTRFDLMDSNDDGKITAAERDAAGAFRSHGRPDGPPLR